MDTEIAHETTLAQLGQSTERYDDMVRSVKKIVEIKCGVLDYAQRDLLLAAYQNVLVEKRFALRAMSSIECGLSVRRDEPDHNKLMRQQLVTEYKGKIMDEYKSICGEVLDLLDNVLLKNSENDESKVFYYKMKGDYYKYLAEYGTPGSKETENDIEEGVKAYEEGKIAAESLATTHPTRLSLTLNYSIFCYEIKNSPDKACQMAKEAFDSAILDLDKLGEETYKRSTWIMQMLKDNLTLWTEGHNDADEDQ